MTPEERRILAQRGKAATEARAILDHAEKQQRALTADEEQTYARLDAEIDKCTRELKLFQQTCLSPEEQEQRREFMWGGDPRSFLYPDEALVAGPRPDAGGPAEWRDTRYRTPELRQAFTRYLREGVHALDGGEFRALQADSDTAGGYLVMPMILVRDIVKAMDDEVFIRKLATIHPVPNAESLGVPSLDNDLGDPTWTAEIATGDEDNVMSFGKRELTPHPVARLIKVSNKLLRSAYINAEALVTGRFIYKLGIVQENAYLNGNGNNQPMGVFTAAQSGFGITTGRDVSDGNLATSITTDGLINALYSLKAQYRRKAVWIFSREALKQIRKLKDGEGNYIWQPGLLSDRPATILGLPYHESEYCPSTFTTKKYVGIVGDFSHYWIAESLAMKIQRLVELYAATNQVGFIARQELDAMPVLEEAFARVKLA